MLGRAQRGVAVISTGAVAGQLATFVATPVLARLYSPTSYGIFASLISIVAVASVAGSLRLESAVSIATEGDARNLVRISAISSLISGLCCAAILKVIGHEFFSQETVLGPIIVTYLVWATAMYTVLTAFWLRTHQYGAVARRNFLQSLGTATGQLSFARWAPTELGLVLGLTIGRSLALFTLIRNYPLSPSRAGAAAPGLTTSLRRYWKFPTIFMPSALLNVVGSQIPLLLVALLYGPDDAGNLAQAIMLGALPAALIGSAISTVFLAELATRVRDGELYQRRRYLKLSRTLLPLGLVWFLLLALVIPRLLPIVLGPGWLLSGSFSLALASSVATGLVVSPLTIVLLIYQRTVLTPAIDLLRVVVVTGVGLGAWAAGFNSVMAVLLMSIGLTCIYVITWFLGLRIVSSRTHESPQN